MDAYADLERREVTGEPARDRGDVGAAVRRARARITPERDPRAAPRLRVLDLEHRPVDRLERGGDPGTDGARDRRPAPVVDVLAEELDPAGHEDRPRLAAHGRGV